MPHRLHDRLLWGLLIVVGIGVAMWAARPRGQAAENLSVVSPFHLIERSGRTVTDADLKGKVWIAGCTFTCCTLSCPKINEAMTRLSQDLKTTDVLLVNFSVDPEHDTPDVLTRYAGALGADGQRWFFLTGPTDQIYPVIEHSFLTRPQINPDPAAALGTRVSHSNRLFLVDRQGQVRGAYACVTAEVSPGGEMTDRFQIDDEELQRLAHDADRLDQGPLAPFLRVRSLPTLNASLNATSAILLLLGYGFIRRRRIAAHIRCMLAAVLVSTLFLASYLYYHALHGATPFAGSGWIRPVYFGILLSHTVLAVIVAPLVLTTVFLGVRGKFQTHRRLARWTLPLWLYVCVTGVLVYLFLYHFFSA